VFLISRSARVTVMTPHDSFQPVARIPVCGSALPFVWVRRGPLLFSLVHRVRAWLIAPSPMGIASAHRQRAHCTCERPLHAPPAARWRRRLPAAAGWPGALVGGPRGGGAPLRCLAALGRPPAAG